MFEKRLQKIVDELKANNELFAKTGFIKDTKNAGGFLGITDEYANYFYTYIKSEEDEDKYKFEPIEGKSCSNIRVNFDFKIVFSVQGCVDSFGVIVLNQLLNIQGVQVDGYSDETETIYFLETEKKLQADYFNLYSFSCKYEGETNVNNILKCSEYSSISQKNCLPL